MLTERYAAIAVGGIVGASARWALGVAIGSGSGFHWAILVANVVGCFALGVLLGREARTAAHRLALHDFGAIGFCGGLTTMSAFSVDIVRYLDNAQYSLAVLYLSANVVGGFLALVLGAAAAKRLLALELPVEEQP